MARNLAVRGAAAAALICALGVAAPVHADPVADFYKGRQISIAVVAAGGAYGANAQLLAEHMGRHIPGNPSIVMIVQSGAGGRTLMNWLYNVAPKDGSALGFLHKDIAAFSLIDPKGVRYKAEEFHWIGSVAPMNSLVFLWHDAKATTLEELRRNQVTMGASGKSHPTAMFPTLLNNLLGTKFQIVTGYRGSSDILLALERGEVKGTTFTWDTVRLNRPDWIEEKKVVPLVQLTLEKDKYLPDVPVLAELVNDAETRKVANFLVSGSKVGRAFGAPPGVPADRIAALRNAFNAVVRDPAYLAHAEKMKMPVEPTSGAEIQSLVESVSAASPAVVQRAKEAIGRK